MGDHYSDGSEQPCAPFPLNKIGFEQLVQESFVY